VIDARPGNFGSRVDYILISGGLKCVGADILPQLYGSDHCPIFADIIVDDDQWMHTPENCQQEPPKLCARNYPQFKNLAKITELFVSYKGGKRAGEELPKDRFDYLDNPPPSRKRRATERQGSLLHFFEPLKDRQSPAADNKAPHMKVPDCETAAIYTVDQTPGNQESLSSSAQDHWANIFGPVQPPRCKVHGEPCKLMRTKKRGANKGREFWVCSRYVLINDILCSTLTLRPTGETLGRCNFFQWAR
jgi:AP endonuclease-2